MLSAHWAYFDTWFCQLLYDSWEIVVLSHLSHCVSSCGIVHLVYNNILIHRGFSTSFLNQQLKKVQVKVAMDADISVRDSYSSPMRSVYKQLPIYAKSCKKKKNSLHQLS